jgi:hypothetical protein
MNQPTLCFAPGPIHEIQRELSGERVLVYAELSRVNPFRAEANHKLRFSRQGPGLLEALKETRP